MGIEYYYREWNIDINEVFEIKRDACFSQHGYFVISFDQLIDCESLSIYPTSNKSPNTILSKYIPSPL